MTKTELKVDIASAANPKTPTKATKPKIVLPPTDNEVSTGRTTVLYGDSTSGKTTNLFEAAIYLSQKYGKPVRLISAEDSSKTVLLPLLKSGVIDAMFISRINDPTTVLRALSAGEWNSPNPYCAYLIEGLTTIAEIIQEDNRENKRFLGEQSVNSYTTVGGEVLSLPGQFSYGFVQMEMARHMRSFAMLPNVERVIWTAHEYKGTLDGPITGPGLVGKAGTASVSKYCGNLLHLDVTSKAGKVERKLYLTSHADPAQPVVTSVAKITLPILAQKRFTELLGIKTVAEPLVVTVNEDGTLKNSLANFLAAEDGAMEELLQSYLTKPIKN
jgi:hypothetical protein